MTFIFSEFSCRIQQNWTSPYSRTDAILLTISHIVLILPSDHVQCFIANLILRSHTYEITHTHQVVCSDSQKFLEIHFTKWVLIPSFSAFHNIYSVESSISAHFLLPSTVRHVDFHSKYVLPCCDWCGFVSTSNANPCRARLYQHYAKMY